MVSAVLALACLTALPTDSGPVPAELVPFLRWVVQDRAASGLNRVSHQPGDPKYGTVYGGAPEDGNIAWVAAAAWQGEWSRFHHDPALRDEAVCLLDGLARIRADGRWDDGGLNAYFGLHSFAWAVLEWLETETIEAERRATWTAAVRAAADDAMLVLATRSRFVGDYANPEFYYLSGLAAAWKVTGDVKYRVEAARALHRYDDRLWPGGGVPYFLESSPEHGYQQMVTKSVVLYHELLGDDHSSAWLRALAEYYPAVQHRSGLIPDSEVPHLKHSLYTPLNPAVPAMLAALTGDGRNRYAADAAAVKRADNVAERMPPWYPQNPNWYNYHHTTYAAAALRILARHPLPDPVPTEARRVFVDHGFRGVRSHWDQFTAAVGTRPMNDTLAGAWLADPAPPMMPLDAAVNGIFFEVLQGDRSDTASPQARGRAVHRAVSWNPVVEQNATAELASVSCLHEPCSPYWADLPWIPGERWRIDEVSGWTSIQHWAVWRDHLVGLGALRCHQAGGDPATDDRAQVRWKFAPATAKLTIDELKPDLWSGRVGGLSVRFEKLAESGSFLFGDEAEAAPALANSVILAHSAPWKLGETVHVATDVHPTASDGAVRFVALNEGAAAVLAEPGGRRALVWVANLTRHYRQYELTLPAGATARVVRRHGELPPVPAGVPVVAPLNGAQSAVMVIDSREPLDPATLVAGLRAGPGRGEGLPPRR